MTEANLLHALADITMLIGRAAAAAVMGAIIALCVLVLVLAAFAPRAAAITDTEPDLSHLDRLDGLTEWDLDVDALDHAQLCEAYPGECDFDDVYDTPDPWGPSRRVCLTHTTEGKHP